MDHAVFLEFTRAQKLRCIKMPMREPHRNAFVQPFGLAACPHVVEEFSAMVSVGYDAELPSYQVRSVR